jgi:hypothetical protein
MGKAGSTASLTGFEITVGLSRVTEGQIVKESVKKER